MTVASVPFLDLVTPHEKLKDEIMDVFAGALSKAQFIGGPMVQDFEQEFARFCRVKHCIGVNSGTDALRFALMAMGIGAGDIVLTVPNTFIATTEAISQANAQIQFIEIDEKTYCIDPEKIRFFLNTQCKMGSDGYTIHINTGKRVRAVIPVHLYGQTAGMDVIGELAKEYNLMVLEDACQAHGADYFSKKENSWKRAGTMGHAAAFSFYPGKNLGACGEGGAVTTNNDEIAAFIRMIRDHGQKEKYIHSIEGYNGRLDSIQAGILKVKLRHLEQWNSLRVEHANTYNKLLSSVSEVILPHQPEWTKPVYHLYVIRAKMRDQLKEHLAKQNIGVGLHYPIPLHRQHAYSSLFSTMGGFPITEKVADELLSLPMFPELTYKQQEVVSEAIKGFYRSKR